MEGQKRPLPPSATSHFVGKQDPVSPAIYGLHGMSSMPNQMLDPVSSAIHGLHGMSSMPNQLLDPVSSAIHGLHGMSSS